VSRPGRRVCGGRRWYPEVVAGFDDTEATVSVYSIWETRCPRHTADEGLEVTRAIWADMPSFDGYLDHEIVEDVDDRAHLFVVSRWRDRESAAAALSYRSHPNAQRADELATEPRRRTVGVAR
jgi:heme-degrading monooxygenase HmoA